MKKIFKLLICMVFALVTALVIFALPSSAEGEMYADIGGHNIAMEDSIRLIYYAAFENVPDGAETGILVYSSYPQKGVFSYDDVNNNTVFAYTETKGSVTHGGKVYYKYYFEDIKAKEMTVNFYAVPYIKPADGSDIYYGEADKYSVLQYAYNKKDSTEKVNEGGETVSQLVSDVLGYGASVQKYLNYNTERLADASYYKVSLENCTLEDGTRKGLYREGETVTINSDDGCGIPTAEPDKLTYSADITVGEEDITVTAEECLNYASHAEGTKYSVSGLTKKIDELYIPSYYRGMPVTGIKDDAFEYKTLSVVHIPDTVETIGARAFANSNVSSVHFPSSLSGLGDGAFNCCKELRRISLPRGLWNLPGNAFSDCTNLSRVTLPDSLKTIGYSAFDGCTKLNYIKIPGRLESIGSNAFRRCSKLKEIDFRGYMAYWDNISKDDWYSEGADSVDIVCEDGTITINFD